MIYAFNQSIAWVKINNGIPIQEQTAQSYQIIVFSLLVVKVFPCDCNVVVLLAAVTITAGFASYIHMKGGLELQVTIAAWVIKKKVSS